MRDESGRCEGCGSYFGHDEGCPNALDHMKVQAVIDGKAKMLPMNATWGWLTRSEMRDCCFACGAKKDLAQQFCGFWFCRAHIEEATEIGAAYWARLNAVIFSR